MFRVVSERNFGKFSRKIGPSIHQSISIRPTAFFEWIVWSKFCMAWFFGLRNLFLALVKKRTLRVAQYKSSAFSGEFCSQFAYNIQTVGFTRNSLSTLDSPHIPLFKESMLLFACYIIYLFTFSCKSGCVYSTYLVLTHFKQLPLVLPPKTNSLFFCKMALKY